MVRFDFSIYVRGRGGTAIWRLTYLIVGVALLATACDSRGDTTTLAGGAVISTTTAGSLGTAAPSTTTTTTAVATVPETDSPPGSTAAEVLETFIAALEGGNAEAAFAVLAPDASWSLSEVELRLGEPIPPELAWLPAVIGVSESTVDALVRGLLELQVAMKSRPSVAGCEGGGSVQTCDYSVVDALTAVLGGEQRGSIGSITVEVRGGQIVRYESDIAPVTELTAAGDEFKRWSAIENPDVARELPLLAWADIVVPLVEAWEAEGRPDSPPPPVTGDDPVAFVAAFIDARNGGDWETMVSLMGGAALDDPFGSRDEFDAAQLLERDITLEECGVVLESASGTRVACLVSITDIIVDAAGITPTNPNRSTLQVTDGRVTALPQFIPSSFLAESAIEEWAATNAAESYAEACPDGIAGQSPIDGLACARFIAENQEGWHAAVSALDL